MTVGVDGGSGGLLLLLGGGVRARGIVVKKVGKARAAIPSAIAAAVVGRLLLLPKVAAEARVA